MNAGQRLVLNLFLTKYSTLSIRYYMYIAIFVEVYTGILKLIFADTNIAGLMEPPRVLSVRLFILGHYFPGWKTFSSAGVFSRRNLVS